VRTHWPFLRCDQAWSRHSHNAFLVMTVGAQTVDFLLSQSATAQTAMATETVRTIIVMSMAGPALAMFNATICAI
jgi:hypothetical protein